MADFTFVTSNEHKVQTAEIVCRQFGITFNHKSADLEEIQSEDGTAIALHKAEQAYELCRAPVAITDDSWSIPGLNGFPGAYMRYVNGWFTPQDFLNLTKNLKDRRIIMTHVIAYKDDQETRIFKAELNGILLKESRGESPITHFKIMSFDGGQHSVAETDRPGETGASKLPNAWHQLCGWLQNR